MWRKQGQAYSVCKFSFGPYSVLGTEDIVELKVQRVFISTVMFMSLDFLIKAMESHGWF